MVQFSEEQMLRRIIDEFGYPLRRAKTVMGKLRKMQPQLKPEFERWWETGEPPQIEIEGYTVARLREERSMNPIAAFLALDWLIREPDLARETLDHGFDRVVSTSSSAVESE